MFPFFKKKNLSAFDEERMVFVGNINLDQPLRNDIKEFPHKIKRILYKRIDKFTPDKKRVIARFLEINDPIHLTNVINRALGLDKEKMMQEINKTLKDFAGRHRNVEDIFMQNYLRIEKHVTAIDSSISKERKLFIGSLFTMEYSNESTSLFNPSVVIYPKQNNLQSGQTRVIFSFRATGEGHISSIVFRSAIIEKNNDVYIEPISRYVSTSKADILSHLDYEFTFPKDQYISERVIFPVSDEESHGIEDARFVRFANDDGSYIYYATYTAYNGSAIKPMLLETKDFHHFKMSLLSGTYAIDKGMALFPRKINGKFAMIGRVDSENLYLMYSTDIRSWNDTTKIILPQEPWEFTKIGNCGSPIETKAGWILITHGVGPMRKYCIGAVLLDKDDPSKVIARLKEPLISPKEEEREGYVPNVVYSCGSILLNDKLIIPYAAADSVSSIAVISLNELLDKLLNRK